MRRTLLSGLAVVLLAPATLAPVAVQARQTPPDAKVPRDDAPNAARPRPPSEAPPPAETRRPSEDRGPQPGEPAPPPSAAPADDKAAKPKLDEAAGGVAGGMTAKVAGTAVAGPVGGIAAGAVGAPVGAAVVRTGKKVLKLGRKPPPTEEASTAADHGRMVADSSTPADEGPAHRTPLPNGDPRT